MNKRTIYVNGLLRLVNTGAQLLPSILVTKILKLLETTTSTSSTVSQDRFNSMHMKTFTYSCLLCCVLVLKGCVEATYFYRSYLLGLNVKVCIYTNSAVLIVLSSVACFSHTLFLNIKSVYLSLCVLSMFALFLIVWCLPTLYFYVSFFFCFVVVVEIIWYNKSFFSHTLTLADGTSREHLWKVNA